MILIEIYQIDMTDFDYQFNFFAFDSDLIFLLLILKQFSNDI